MVEQAYSDVVRPGASDLSSPQHTRIGLLLFNRRKDHAMRYCEPVHSGIVDQAIRRLPRGARASLHRESSAGVSRALTRHALPRPCGRLMQRALEVAQVKWLFD